MTRRVIAVAAALLIVAALIAAPLGLKPYGIYILSLWAVTTIAAIGLNLTLGYAGQVSLAQGAFVGIGAYAAALLTTKGWPLGVVDNFAAAYLSAQYRAAIPLVLLIAVILFRPQGLLGRAEERTV